MYTVGYYEVEHKVKVEVDFDWDERKQEGYLIIDEWFYTRHPEIFRFMPKKAELQKTLF